MPSLNRTFSHIDVIRIFERHLTQTEKDIVIEFFGGQDPNALFTKEQLNALRSTKSESLGDSGVITTTSELIGILALAISQLGSNYSTLEQTNINQEIEVLEELRDDPDMPSILRIFYTPVINIIIDFLILVRDILEPLTLLYNVGVALTEQATNLEQFRATVGIWAPKVD